MALIIGLTISAVIGYLFAHSEAWEVCLRIRESERLTLPHGMLLVARAIVLGGLAYWCADGDGWMRVLDAGLLTAAFAPVAAIVHRFSFNKITRYLGVSRTREWYYLGSPRRTKHDSKYDTFWWRITAKRSAELCTNFGTQRMYKPIFTGAPFVACCTCEALVAIAALWLR